MSEILIKNMEMPKEKDDVVILTIQPDGTTNIFGRRLLSLLRPSAEIHGLRKGITKAIELPPHGDLIPNPWHTGTPTEKGWYLIQTKGGDYMAVEKNSHGLWLEDDYGWREVHSESVVAWQKIEPYKETD